MMRLKLQVPKLGLVPGLSKIFLNKWKSYQLGQVRSWKVGTWATLGDAGTGSRLEVRWDLRAKIPDDHWSQLTIHNEADLLDNRLI